MLLCYLCSAVLYMSPSRFYHDPYALLRSLIAVAMRDAIPVAVNAYLSGNIHRGNAPWAAYFVSTAHAAAKPLATVAHAACSGINSAGHAIRDVITLHVYLAPNARGDNAGLPYFVPASDQCMPPKKLKITAPKATCASAVRSAFKTNGTR